MNKNEEFWTNVMTVCVSEFSWGEEALKQVKAKNWQKTFASFVKDMDEAEFKVFLAKVVIEASGQGVVGTDLTDHINTLRDLRASK